MASTLLRFGLWIIVIALAMYVIHESFEDSPVAEYVPMGLLQKALAAGGILLVAGVIFKVLEKGAKVVTKNRCRVCRVPIPPGGIYCRQHLRNILHEEDERTHMTRLR